MPWERRRVTEQEASSQKWRRWHVRRRVLELFLVLAHCGSYDIVGDSLTDHNYIIIYTFFKCRSGWGDEWRCLSPPTSTGASSAWSLCTLWEETVSRTIYNNYTFFTCTSGWGDEWRENMPTYPPPLTSMCKKLSYSP